MKFLKETSFWFFIIAIAYCLVMLVYISIKLVFKDSAEMISAFGSILSAFGAFFTALIAVYVFNGWKHTEDHKTKNNHINNAVNCFFKLQETIKLSLDKGIEIHKLCNSNSFSFSERTQILILISKLQAEISFSIREFTLHMQFFSTVGDEPVLGREFQQVIDQLSSNININYSNLANSVGEKNPQEIINLFNIYSTFINSTLVIDLHKKIIIEMAKKSKAITKE